ncbi:U4/U6 small nuclear ribonucleoprotein PRP3, partial [Phenoliferia sp. Uapishka_3]
MGRGHARDVLKFNQKGKFVKLGEAIRAEAKMEELKKRILESAKKAGLESEMEDQAKVIKRPAPPEVEWWDTPFLPGQSYDSYTPDYLETSGAITLYVQHPIQIPAPQDKIVIQPKDLFLTKKEQKKMRRQRRLADMQDKQDRVKMGLLPPPPPKGQSEDFFSEAYFSRYLCQKPPKVKLSNMMNVLTQDAIADPTKIEAKVKREMAARENGHLRMNAERKLTDEQRREKVAKEHDKDESKGIHAVCFKVRYLSNGAHKFKLKKNAEQQHLTGVCIFNPKFCLVLVEGGAKAVKFYKRLMLTRIDWTSEAVARDGDEPATKDELSTADPAGEPEAMEGLDEPESLADNKCSLVWEGVHREKMFSYFKLHNCPSDSNARDVLGPKLEGLWDVAKVDGRDDEE